MKFKTTSQSVKLGKKVMDNIKRGFLKVLQPLIKMMKMKTRLILVYIQMGFVLSFLLHPLLDFLRGGLVGFVRRRQGPKHPPAPLGTRCCGGTEPTALQCPWLGLPPTLALSSIKKERDDTWLECFRQKTVQDEPSPKSNNAIYCQIEKDVQENILGLESIPSSKPRYPNWCSYSALAEVTRNTTTLRWGDTAPGLNIQLSVFHRE